MKFDPDRHHRRSVRLQGWDYASAGGYFVTICVEGRMSLFGEVVDGEMILNEFGQIAVEEWEKGETLRDNVILDAFVIMPNHMHGIVFLNDTMSGKSVGTREKYQRCFSSRAVSSEIVSRRDFGHMRTGSISALVRAYKAAVTRAINRAQGTEGAKVWQGRFHEHIIRNLVDLERIREYVANNALQWEMDRYHPDHERKVDGAVD